MEGALDDGLYECPTEVLLSEDTNLYSTSLDDLLPNDVHLYEVPVKIQPTDEKSLLEQAKLDQDQSCELIKGSSSDDDSECFDTLRRPLFEGLAQTLPSENAYGYQAY